MADFSFEVKQELGTIGEPTASGWQTKLTLVSWNGREPKYDIRSWSPDMTKMGKGISFTRDELLDLNNLLYTEFDEESSHDEDDDDCGYGEAISLDEALAKVSGADEPTSHEEMLAELADMGDF